VRRCCRSELDGLPNVAVAALRIHHGRPPPELGKMTPTAKNSAMARAKLGMAGDGRLASSREGHRRRRGGWPAAGRGIGGGG
jgi:hypothetical protein